MAGIPSTTTPRRLPAWRILAILVAAFALIQFLLREDPASLIAATDLQLQLQQSPAPLLLDVRSLEEYHSGHIPGAQHIDYRNLDDHLDALRRQVPDRIVVYCETGVRSRIARYQLLRAGFAEVLHLEGDLRRWRRLELPLTTQAPSAYGDSTTAR